MSTHQTFLPLLAVLLLALIVPLLLARRLRWMPVVVGEILVGLLIGRSAFNLVRSDATLDFLAEIGLAILMFLSGLEIDFSAFSGEAASRRTPVKVVGLALFTFAASLFLAGAVSRELAARGIVRDPWLIALILSTTSLGVVVPILKERGLSSGPFGQVVLLASVAADFFTMFLITILVAVRSTGLSPNVLLVGVLFVAALLAYRVGRAHRKARSSIIRRLAERAAPSTHVRLQGAIALLIAFVILAKSLGTEMILGAFLAGTVLSLIGRPEDKPVRQHLEALGFGFFVPIFFLTVGIRFDLAALVGDRRTLVLTAVLLGSAFAVKLVPALAFKAMFSWRETLAAGALLSARLSLIIAASNIGAELGLIDGPTNASFILVAAISSTVAPLISQALLSRPGDRRAERMAVFGGGDVGIQVSLELNRHGIPVTYVGTGAVQTGLAAAAGVDVAAGDDPLSALKAMGPGALRGAIVMTGNDDSNLSIGRLGFSLGTRHIIGDVSNPARIPEYRDLGIKAFEPGLFRAPLLALLARNPDIFDLFLSEKDRHQVLEIGVRNPDFEGKALQDVRFGVDVLVISIRRAGEFLVPRGHTRLEKDDDLIVSGSREALRELADRLERA